MATGRTLKDYQRVYISGHNMSGYIVDTGEQGVAFGEPDQTCLLDVCKGTIPTKPMITCGPVNGVFDNTAAVGLHVLQSAAQGTVRNVSVLYGIMAAPAAGDPCFCAPMYLNYKGVGTEIVTAKLELSGVDVTQEMAYRQYFGKVLHIMGAETGANSADTAVDDGAATTAGGWLMYHISDYAGTGSATISIDDSANGTSWAALSGATSGAIAHTSMPASGIVQLGTTATVRQYLRWQLSLSTLTSCTFALMFIRGI